MQDEATCEWHLKLDHNSTGGNRAPHDHPCAHLLANIPLTIRSRPSESLAGVPLPQPAFGGRVHWSRFWAHGLISLHRRLYRRSRSDESLLQRSLEFREGHFGRTDTGPQHRVTPQTLPPRPAAGRNRDLVGRGGGSGWWRRKSTAARPPLHASVCFPKEPSAPSCLKRHPDLPLYVVKNCPLPAGSYRGLDRWRRRNTGR